MANSNAEDNEEKCIFLVSVCGEEKVFLEILVFSDPCTEVTRG